MNLLQILNIIEKKLDKESDSSKYGSHMPLDEKRKTRSVSRYHHHSQGILIREHIIAHVHPLSRIKRVMGWMNCEEK
jgi:hypothetical protein